MKTNLQPLKTRSRALLYKATLLLGLSGICMGHQASALGTAYALAPHYDPYEGLHMGSQTVDVTVSGTVVDQNGDPIPGVTVSIPGSGIGTATDLDGKYSLAVPEGASLVFSYIGYVSQTVEVGTQSVINITLNEDVAALEEV